MAVDNNGDTPPKAKQREECPHSPLRRQSSERSVPTHPSEGKAARGVSPLTPPKAKQREECPHSPLRRQSSERSVPTHPSEGKAARGVSPHEAVRLRSAPMTRASESEGGGSTGLCLWRGRLSPIDCSRFLHADRPYLHVCPRARDSKPPGSGFAGRPPEKHTGRSYIQIVTKQHRIPISRGILKSEEQWQDH